MPEYSLIRQELLNLIASTSNTYYIDLSLVIDTLNLLKLNPSCRNNSSLHEVRKDLAKVIREYSIESRSCYADASINYGIEVTSVDDLVDNNKATTKLKNTVANRIKEMSNHEFIAKFSNFETLVSSNELLGVDVKSNLKGLMV